jgi:hypothetical protein
MRQPKHVPTPSIWEVMLRWLMPWRYPDVYTMKYGDTFGLVENPERFRVFRNEDYLHCEVCNNVPTKGESRRFAHGLIRWQVRR